MNNSKHATISDVKRPLVEHLDELRSTIIKTLISILVATAICFYLTPHLMELLKQPLLNMLHTYYPDNPENHYLLRSLHPSGAFMVAMKVAFSAGFIISLPFVCYFVGKFLIPALSNHEKKLLKYIFLAGGGLFLVGILFCYYIALPFSLRFLWNMADWIGITNDWTIENYITFTTRFLLLFGFTFETPAVILLFVLAGFLRYQHLKKFRRYVIVGIFVIAAIITPPDVITQLILALPLILLYELSVVGSFIIQKYHTKKHSLAG